jgi:hypothetical protein
MEHLQRFVVEETQREANFRAGGNGCGAEPSA